MNSNDVKKELLKSKVMAKFSHYISGNLYYQVQLEGGLYQFPISTVEDNFSMYSQTGFEDSTSEYIKEGLKLSSDLGTTSFDNEIKASFLNRWIDMAINNSEFIKIN